MMHTDPQIYEGSEKPKSTLNSMDWVFPYIGEAKWPIYYIICNFVFVFLLQFFMCGYSNNLVDVYQFTQGTSVE